MYCPHCGREIELRAVGSGEAYELDERSCLPDETKAGYEEYDRVICAGLRASQWMQERTVLLRCLHCPGREALEQVIGKHAVGSMLVELDSRG